MPPRSSPNGRRRRLGGELRKLRERAGVTAREAGQLLSVNAARLSSIESGRFGVSAERVRMSAHEYGCVDEASIAALADLTVGRGRQ
ncbi:helix-turn-helix domain-containing protein [Streptomyces sp. NPDC018019]|uniref:helix-turn-helix domain-containing protein n=1 Tax=Streptomyces sp. NPDC018019 TaxID=3365030 RepID=UPI0037933027